MPSRRKNNCGSGTGKPSQFNRLEGKNRSGIPHIVIVTIILMARTFDKPFM
jgi:hypothetical protein